jgi:anthraniloyl-CoA monooxygenase
VKVAVVGAGPGGLYLSLLLKKVAPSHDVVVIEKNPAGATYGWGVVFSDRTLASFREADLKSYTEITDDFIIWDAIDIRYRDEVIRCGGQVFSGIARKRLLEILSTRAADLGVRLEYEREVPSVSELEGFDFVVGADGVRSMVRSTFPEAFRPRSKEGRSRYIWFGTKRVFDSFTFAFRTDEHGFFQAHAYPFDGSTSTFIVECSDEVWHRAGLDNASEAESIAYCERLFADDLGGHGLMSNRSAWISFVTLKNRAWHHGRFVLLGDAAHTAHFSIGSGTKLAMEDSIALANALEAHADVESALVEYELERKPRVERLQEAARQSQTYFENTGAYQHMEPLQFAFHLLSRSGRIDYDDLRVRDRHFVGDVDRWFFAHADGRSRALALPPAFAPGRLGELEVPNRVAVECGPTSATDEGLPVPGMLEKQTSSGAGLLFTGSVAVSRGGRVTPTGPGLYTDEQEAAWKEEVASARASAPVVLAITLGHAGARGATRARDRYVDVSLPEGEAWDLVAASPLPYTSRSRIPRAMHRGDMDHVVEEFAAATRRARDAGFDMVEIDMSHGYLLAGFISPLTNKRTDEYGGALENRLRFPLEILGAVRAEWPAHLPVGVAISASDWAPRGLPLSEAIETSGRLMEHGASVVRVGAGQTVSRYSPRYDPYFLTHLADRVRNGAHVATIATGDIATVDHVNTIVAGGRADFCLLRR